MSFIHLDILLLSPLGIVVDLVDGAAWKYDEQLFVTLKQASGAVSKKEDDSEVSLMAMITFKEGRTGKVYQLGVPLVEKNF